MGSFVSQNGQEHSGTNASSPFLSEPEQGVLALEVERPDWRRMLRNLIGLRIKEVGVRIFGGDPEQARTNLIRILEEKNHRHFDVTRLDDVVEELGPEAGEVVVRFVCNRYGFQMPERKPDPIRVEERVAKLEKSASDLADAANAIVQELAAIRVLQGKKP